MIKVGKKNPLDFAVLQTYEIVTQYKSHNSWQARVIEKLASNIEQDSNISVQDHLLKKCIDAIDSIKGEVSHDMKVETLVSTQRMLENARHL